jgi:quinol monooxygenase YgiN
MVKKNTTQVVCIAEFHAMPGKTEELIVALHSLIEPTHKEPGCLHYHLNQRLDNDRWITFTEKWKDRNTFDTHCAMPYIKHFFDNLRPLLVDEFEVKLYEEIVP